MCYNLYNPNWKFFVTWFIDIYLFSVVVYIIFILHLYLHSHSIRIYLFFHKHCILADSEKFYGPKCVKNWQDIKLSDDKLFPYRGFLGMGYVLGLVWVRSGFWSDLDRTTYLNQPMKCRFCYSHHKSLIFRISL